MLQSTIDTVTRIIQSDPGTTPEQIKAVLKACQAKLVRRRLGTKHDAAKILGLHPESVKRYARRGLLTPIKITARRVRYDLDECYRLANYGTCSE
jgi:hypothetical protein